MRPVFFISELISSIRILMRLSEEAWERQRAGFFGKISQRYNVILRNCDFLEGEKSNKNPLDFSKGLIFRLWLFSKVRLVCRPLTMRASQVHYMYKPLAWQGF